MEAFSSERYAQGAYSPYPTNNSVTPQTLNYNEHCAVRWANGQLRAHPRMRLRLPSATHRQCVHLHAWRVRDQMIILIAHMTIACMRVRACALKVWAWLRLAQLRLTLRVRAFPFIFKMSAINARIRQNRCARLAYRICLGLAPILMRL